MIGRVSVFLQHVEYRQHIWMLSVACLEGTRSVFLGYSQRRVPATFTGDSANCFSTSALCVSGVPASCCASLLDVFPRMPTISFQEFPQQVSVVSSAFSRGDCEGLWGTNELPQWTRIYLKLPQKILNELGSPGRVTSDQGVNPK